MGKGHRPCPSVQEFYFDRHALLCPSYALMHSTSNSVFPLIAITSLNELIRNDHNAIALLDQHFSTLNLAQTFSDFS